MTKKQKRSAAQSPAFRKFQAELYQALEVLLNKAQDEINDELRQCFTRSLEVILARYTRIISLPELAALSQSAFIASLDQALEPIFEHAAQRIFLTSVQLSKNAQVLAYVGTAEAIGRATQSVARYQVPETEIAARSSKGIDDEDLYSRIVLALSRIKRRLLDASQYSLVTQEDPNEMLSRAFHSLPKPRPVKRPKKVLRQLTEAEAKPRVDFASGFVTDEAWDAIVQDYLTEYIPKWRGPEVELDIKTEWTGTDLRYGWEFEQYLADDFVRKVRDGQQPAAKENGVVDFQWIAIIDDRTDECCSWRDGLTTREIEAKLRSDHRGDECRAVVPPAHFNCRCDLAPMLEDMPESPISNQKEFEEWLLT